MKKPRSLNNWLVCLVVLFSFSAFAYSFTFEEPTRYKLDFEDLAPQDSDHSIPCPSEFYYAFADKDIILRTPREYEDFVNAKINCNAQKPPRIDLSRKTIIGRYVIASGCKSPIFDKEVIQDDNKKEVKYIITVRQKGTCPRLWADLNLIAVPKVEENYQVIIEVRETVETEEVAVSVE